MQGMTSAQDTDLRLLNETLDKGLGEGCSALDKSSLKVFLQASSDW